MSEHLSDLELDALRIGGATASDATRTHLESCETCIARRRTLDEAAQGFAARFDVVALAAQTLVAAEEQRTPWWRKPWMPVLIAATAALLLVVVVPQQERVRIKGDAPLLEVFVIEGGARTPVTGPVARDAHLAIRVSPEGPREVRILWSSAPNAWTSLYPEKDERSWRIDAPAWLDREVVLDGADEDEELAVIACEQSFGNEDALRMLLDEPRADCAIERARIDKR